MFAESTLSFQQNAVNLILRQGNTDEGQPAPEIGFDHDPDTHICTLHRCRVRARDDTWLAGFRTTIMIPEAQPSLTETKETSRPGNRK
jgi:hypothetical protein